MITLRIPWPVLLGAGLGAGLITVAAARLLIRELGLWVMRTAENLISSDDLTICDYCDGAWFLECECEGDCGRRRCPQGAAIEDAHRRLLAEAEGSGEHG